MDNKLGFWNALGKSQTYLNMLYLLISYPLGLIYFIFIVVGLSLGFGLFITWFGIPILVGVMFIWLGFAYFERNLNRVFLKIDIPYSSQLLPKKTTIWTTLKNRFTDSYTWKSFGYLILKFPLGILAFCVLVIFISITLSFIATPILFYLFKSGVIFIPECSGSEWCWAVNWPFAVIIGLIGILMIFVSLFVFNGLSKSYGFLARAMLSNKSKISVVKRAKKSVTKPKRKTRKKNEKKRR